jgi:cell division protein FtsX
MDNIPHTRRILGNRSLEMTEPNPFDHAAIIRVTRPDSAAVIADLVEALEAAFVLKVSNHPIWEAKARAALAKAKGEVA